MEKDRQTKIIAIVALVIGITSLSIGFAIFSAQLRIQSKAIVTPAEDSFKVVLSKSQTEEVVGKVTPLGNGEEAIIDNTGNPTISNLKANFTKPGQRVEYEFYVVNTGDLDAFLNKIEFNAVSGSTENKVCTAGEGTTQSLVDSACSSIHVTVKVHDEERACATSTYNAHSLAKSVGEKVIVTIEYAKSGAMADGPFEVAFGDVTLNYSTTDSEGESISGCTDYNTKVYNTKVEDLDGDGKISKSDKVTLGTESFYVICTDEEEGTVTMLAEWNLNVGANTASGEPGIQNPTCKGWVSTESYYCTVAFSSTNYWSSSVSKYPAWVYDNNDIVLNHVNTYVNKLKAVGYSSVTGRLIKHEELVDLGCVASGGPGACNSAPSWVKNTCYWSGTAYNSTFVWRVDINGYLDSGVNDYQVSTSTGVRPVITINASEIKDNIV